MNGLDYRLVAFQAGNDPDEVPTATPWHGLRPRAADGMIRTFCGLVPHTPGVTIGTRDEMLDATRCQTCRGAEARILSEEASRV